MKRVFIWCYEIVNNFAVISNAERNLLIKGMIFVHLLLRKSWTEMHSDTNIHVRHDLEVRFPRHWLTGTGRRSRLWKNLKKVQPEIVAPLRQSTKACESIIKLNSARWAEINASRVFCP